MMVGRAVSLNIDRPLNENQTERLRVEHLTIKNKEGVKMLDDVDRFEIKGSELTFFDDDKSLAVFKAVEKEPAKK